MNSMTNPIIDLSGCIIYNRNRDILLLHRNTANKVQWEIPGGKREHGETAEECARREIKEEIGITINSLTPIGVGEFFEDNINYIFTWFSSTTTLEPKIIETNTFDQIRFIQPRQIRESLNPRSSSLHELISSNSQLFK